VLVQWYIVSKLAIEGISLVFYYILFQCELCVSLFQPIDLFLVTSFVYIRPARLLNFRGKRYTHVLLASLKDPGHVRTIYVQGGCAGVYVMAFKKKSKLCSYRSVHMYGHVQAYD